MREVRHSSNEALGAGLDFPFNNNPMGGLAVARDEEKVRQSIMMILSTAKGERVMRPDFGCDIHSFVFATLDRSTLTQINSAVSEALMRWEPRIDVNDITMTNDKAHGGRLLIELNYTIRHINFPANLVYPFYLRYESQ